MSQLGVLPFKGLIIIKYIYVTFVYVCFVLFVCIRFNPLIEYYP